MYIIELFIKLKNDIKSGKINFFKKQKKTLSQDRVEEKCEHLFLPVDSTKKILACSKCGMIYKLKKNEKNPFE